MALPDRDVAMTWGGKMLVDRDGAEIGRVRQMYTDDATGRPEWATAVLGGSTLFVPLLDATESDGRVRLTVRRDDVVRAPSVGDVQHISEDEEAMLYRHYGIAFSRDASKTLLPAAVAGRSGARSAPRLRGWVGGQEGISASDGGTRMLMILIAAAVAGLLAVLGTVAVVLRRMRTTRSRRRTATPVARVADEAGAVADAATTAATTAASAASAATSAAASAVGSAASHAKRPRRGRGD